MQIGYVVGADKNRTVFKKDNTIESCTSITYIWMQRLHMKTQNPICSHITPRVYLAYGSPIDTSWTYRYALATRVYASGDVLTVGCRVHLTL